MSEQKETVFARGLFVEKPSTKAPDFVIANKSYKVSEFVAFLQEHQNQAGYVNTTVLMSKDGQKYYEALNQFEPKKPDSLEEVTDTIVDAVEDEEGGSPIPF